MNVLKVPLATSSTQLCTKEFWNSVMLYHNRPHLVNRKLLAASQVLFYKINLPNKEAYKIQDAFSKPSILYEMRKLKSLTKEYISVQFIKNIVEGCFKVFELLESSAINFDEWNEGIFISVRILLPRNRVCPACLEVAILNKNKNSALFLAVGELGKLLCAPPFSYEIELNAYLNLVINLNNFEDADTASAEWLGDILFTKLMKWSKEENSACMKSLSLVEVDEYCITYNRLKLRYAEDLVQKWPSKTTTNPQKYIFEDLAIASYLICLWKTYNQMDINFVDLGCGNGLLVFLLNKEGYKGYGIDLRKRPIWEIYPQEICLQVGTVSPDSIFPQSTWIIGNHSDELTPWIPVVALKSSPQTNYFVLPCCPYEFSGKKYIRENTSISQYSDYMLYIEKVSKKCGFETKIDKLRIPSTKKVCLVGITSSSVALDTRKLLISTIDEFINNRSTKNFTARNSIEKVRNCTKIDRNIINKVVKDIVYLLLNTKNDIQKYDGSEWNRGSSLSISLICENLSKDDLKNLKKECGGVQTLLRNHRYLFEVEKGSVQLRLPYHLKDVGNKYRDKPCWYFRHHLTGCLLRTEECAYKH